VLCGSFQIAKIKCDLELGMMGFHRAPLAPEGEASAQA